MITYETYCKIRLYHRERGLSFSQIGSELGIDPETVARYARMEAFAPRRAARRPSKLDAFKPLIVRWLERHPYSAVQIFQKLREEHGYAGGYSILKDYVRTVRPSRRPAYLSLAFAPGEAAQVDWGSCRHHHPGSDPPPALVLCHGALPQPHELSGVHLRRGHGALPRLPSQRPGVLRRGAIGASSSTTSRPGC